MIWQAAKQHCCNCYVMFCFVVPEVWANQFTPSCSWVLQDAAKALAYGRNRAALRHLPGPLPTFSAKYAIFSVSILCKMWNSRSEAHRFNKSCVFFVLFFSRSLEGYATICRYAPCRSMIQQVDLRSGRIKRYCKGCYQQRSCWLASGYGKAIRHFMVRHK